MKCTRIAVLGLYRSGSTAVAGVLHHLGVDMGPPFFGGYYESDWLSKQLRIWWNEKGDLEEKVSRSERVKVLTQWIQEREKTGALWIGMKHPLLSLCGDDLVEAWGAETCFIRCCRPLDESVSSMKKGMKYRGDADLRQRTLLKELDRFFEGRSHLQIVFSEMMEYPEREVRKIIDFLQIKPEPQKVADAVQWIAPGSRAKVEGERLRAKQATPRYKIKQFFRNLVKHLRAKT